MVSDGFQTQKRGSWIPGKERAERGLASAISIDGREEWTCKFCSESDAWEVQAGDRRKDWRMDYGPFDVTRGGRQKVQIFGGRT